MRNSVEPSFSQLVRGPAVSEGASETKLSNEELVEAYAGLVYSISNKLKARMNMRIALEDIEAYGFIGLIDAYERFDPNQETAFSSYAYWRIRGAIIDGCRTQGWVSHHALRRARSLEGIGEYMETEARAAPTQPGSFSDAVNRVSNMVGAAAAVVLVAEHEEFESPELPQDDLLAREQHLVLLKEAFKFLSSQERDVLTRFYQHGESMSTIGKHHGHTKSWVSRVHTRAIERIRDHMLPQTE